LAFRESMFCTLTWEPTTEIAAVGLGFVDSGCGRSRGHPGGPGGLPCGHPGVRGNGTLTEKELMLELPGVVLVILTVKSVLAPATADVGVTSRVNCLVAAKLGTAPMAMSNVAATIAKSARRFQLMVAAMWNSFPSACPSARKARGGL